MKAVYSIVFGTLALLIAGTPGSADASAILDFDGLPSFTNAVPGGYGGLNWAGFNVVGDGENIFSGVHAVSPNNYVYAGCCNLTPDEITVGSGTFDLLSGYFGTAQNNSESFTVHGFIGVNEIFTQVLALNGTSTYFALNMTGVDRVKFDSSFIANLVMDNLEVNVPSAPTRVPEPTSIWLLGSGVAMLAARRRAKA